MCCLCVYYVYYIFVVFLHSDPYFYLFFLRSCRKTDSMHHPDWAVPALPLLLRREDPDAQTLSLSPPPPPLPPLPPLLSFSLYQHTDGIRRWGLASKESGCVAGKPFHATHTHTHSHTDVQIHSHWHVTNSFNRSNRNIYSVFLNYNSSVKAITFVDNHLNSGVVILLLIF